MGRRVQLTVAGKGMTLDAAKTRRRNDEHDRRAPTHTGSRPNRAIIEHEGSTCCDYGYGLREFALHLVWQVLTQPTRHAGWQR